MSEAYPRNRYRGCQLLPPPPRVEGGRAVAVPHRFERPRELSLARRKGNRGLLESFDEAFKSAEID